MPKAKNDDAEKPDETPEADAVTEEVDDRPRRRASEKGPLLPVIRSYWCKRREKMIDVLEVTRNVPASRNGRPAQMVKLEKHVECRDPELQEKAKAKMASLEAAALADL